MRAVYKVMADGDRWAIKLEGTYTPVAILDRKNDAVKAARDMAERDIPSRLVVIDGRGKVESDKLLGTDQLERDVQGMRAMEEPMPEGLKPMPEMEDEET
ncbi:MAG: DUF2188 domain-containing protein [Pseudomonadota bacterium]|nr:DUF2188 domain-containing protein [Pseudomonadota bacterium]